MSHSEIYNLTNGTLSNIVGYSNGSISVVVAVTVAVAIVIGIGIVIIAIVIITIMSSLAVVIVPVISIIRTVRPLPSSPSIIVSWRFLSSVSVTSIPISRIFIVFSPTALLWLGYRKVQVCGKFV